MEVTSDLSKKKNSKAPSYLQALNQCSGSLEGGERSEKQQDHDGYSPKYNHTYFVLMLWNEDFLWRMLDRCGSISNGDQWG